MDESRYCVECERLSRELREAQEDKARLERQARYYEAMIAISFREWVDGDAAETAVEEEWDDGDVISWLANEYADELPPTDKPGEDG